VITKAKRSASTSTITGKKIPNTSFIILSVRIFFIFMRYFGQPCSSTPIIVHQPKYSRMVSSP
jgi:hypothetical protein